MTYERALDIDHLASLITATRMPNGRCVAGARRGTVSGDESIRYRRVLTPGPMRSDPAKCIRKDRVLAGSQLEAETHAGKCAARRGALRAGSVFALGGGGNR